VWKWDQQEPFGNNVADENPSGLGAFDLPLRLPGQYFDKETNLHYNYFRDYDPSIGRYGESDPIGLLGGLNTYSYVVASPLRFVDRKGKQPLSPEESLTPPSPGASSLSDTSTYMPALQCAQGVANSWWITSGTQNWRGNDKRLHCVISCEIMKKCGTSVAVIAGVGREAYQLIIQGDILDRRRRGDSAADEAANQYGRSCPPQIDCYQHCVGRY
jgi:RHS repeat-associated protein